MKVLEFSQVFEDITSKFQKIKKEDYLKEGKLPIIDQGQSFIGGFSNDENLISEKNLPVVIFGDHTRNFKYVDFPFTIGADGVKVLSLINKSYCSKYFYYYLKTLNLPDSGYSRHFKYLKNTRLRIPDKVEDQFIQADILSKVESLIAKRKESICLLDAFLKSTFLEMFGNPNQFNENDTIKKIEDICWYRGGGTPSKSKPEYFQGDIPWVSPKDMKSILITSSVDKITREAIEHSSTIMIPKGSLLMVIRSGILKSKLPVAINKVDVAINQDLKAFNSQEVSSEYLLYFFLSMEKNILKRVKGTTADNLSFEDIKTLKIKIPAITQQDRFSQVFRKTEAVKLDCQNSLQELENLYCSLSQKAFRGELMEV